MALFVLAIAKRLRLVGEYDMCSSTIQLACSMRRTKTIDMIQLPSETVTPGTCSDSGDGTTSLINRPGARVLIVDDEVAHQRLSLMQPEAVADGSLQGLRCLQNHKAHGYHP